MGSIYSRSFNQVHSGDSSSPPLPSVQKWVRAHPEALWPRIGLAITPVAALVTDRCGVGFCVLVGAFYVLILGLISENCCS